jgi:hypothetical protein
VELLCEGKEEEEWTGATCAGYVDSHDAERGDAPAAGAGTARSWFA